MEKKFLIKCAAVFASLLAGLLPQTASAQTLPYRMGYWYTFNMNNGGMQPSSMNGLWSGINYLIISDLYPNSNGSISNPDPNFATNVPAICNAARANGVQCIVDIAALGPGAGDISGAVTNNLSGFISNLVTIMNTYGFAGFTTDWEYNYSSSLNDSFTHALRAAIGSKLIIEGASAYNSYSYWGGPILSYVDAIITGGYDLGYCSPGGISWFNAALYNDASGGGSVGNAFTWNSIVTSFKNVGVPAAKIIIGTTFLTDLYFPNRSAPRQSCSSGSITTNRINYSNVAASYNVSNPTLDPVTFSTWIPVSGSSWLDYAGPTSLTYRVHYLQQNNLGGFAAFNLFADYVPSQSPQHPLLAAMEAASGTSSTSAPSITSTSPLPAGTGGTSYSQTLTSSGSTPITWTVASGALPAGLSLNSSTGVISGTPTTAGSSSFTIEARNTAGNNSRQFSLTINPTSTAAWFNLISKNSGLCLDVPRASSSPGLQLQQWACWGGDNQKFQFTPVQGGYEITAKSSGLQLDVQGGPSATQNGVPITQWPYWGGSNEIWNFVPSVDGSYSITALSSGKCVDVTGTSTSNGATIQQWTCKGTNNQKWKLAPVQ